MVRPQLRSQSGLPHDDADVKSAEGTPPDAEGLDADDEKGGKLCKRDDGDVKSAKGTPPDADAKNKSARDAP